MIEIDYKKVVYVLISEGLIQEDQVRRVVGKLAVVESLDESQNSPLWKAAERLCALLNERVIANGFNPFAVNKKSVGVMEKLLRLDKRTEEQVVEIINWASQDSFWYMNIRSPEKLRKHFDLMSAQSQKRRPTIPDKTPAIQRQAQDFAKELERQRQEAVPMPPGFKDVLKKRNGQP